MCVATAVRTGTVKWLRRPVGLDGIGRLRIASVTKRGLVCKEYDVAALVDQGRVVGYHLVDDSDTHYHVDATWCPDGSIWLCDCPDACYRNRECKHARALRVAYDRLSKE